MSQSRLLYRGKVIDVCSEKVKLPNGVEAEFETVRHPGGAAIVALDAHTQVCLLRQYRHVVGDWIWELPAGKTDNNEPPLMTAQRELAEEAGLSAARWDTLGKMLSSPGVFREVVHLFLARDLATVKADIESLEFIEVHWLALPQALAMAARGEIDDAKTVMGLFRGHALLQR